MRIAVVLLLAAHGLLHVLGFLKTWGLADLPGLSGKTALPLSATGTRALGLVWLVAAFVFLLAAALRAFLYDAWWLFAGAALLLSQGLICFQWQDAKAGTAANVLIALSIALVLAQGARR